MYINFDHVINQSETYSLYVDLEKDPDQFGDLAEPAAARDFTKMTRPAPLESS